MTAIRVVTAAALALGVAAAALAAKPVRVDKDKVEGTILEMREGAATREEGPFAEIRIRDRVRKDLWLRLGPAEEARDRFRVGDRVRGEILSPGPGEPAAVLWIHNERTRERDRIRARDGSMLSAEERARDRDRERAKAQERDRDRARDQAPGDRPGAGDRPGGGGDRPGGPPGPGRP
jgi:hypothetical protein